MFIFVTGTPSGGRTLRQLAKWYETRSKLGAIRVRAARRVPSQGSFRSRCRGGDGEERETTTTWSFH